jgi:hypothetical protein
MKISLPLLLSIFFLSQVHASDKNCSSIEEFRIPPPPATEYYTLAPGGDMTTFIWSKSSHTGSNCSCTPDVCSPFDIPSNAIIYIAHPITINCDIFIGSNSTIIIESGGSLTVTGNANISGTGFFQIDAGGSANVSGDFSVTGTGDATINGSLTVGGDINFTGGGGSLICGSGTISVTGTVTGSTDPCFTGALPIELLYFNADANNEKIDLRWATASETNNDYFTVERSKDGELWSNLLNVDGAGNSSYIIQYLDFDLKPLNGTSYYRLKQTDYDGNFSYSNIAVVHYSNGSGLDVTVFPNPNDGNSFNLEFIGFGNEEVLIVIRDVIGREYYSKAYLVSENNTIYAVSLTDKLPSGTYLITASSDENVLSKKIVVR